MTTQMKTNKITKRLAALLSILLAAVIGFAGSVQLIARAAEEVLYVEDVQLAVVDSGSGAKSRAQRAVGNDYIIAEKVELNPGTDTGKDVYLAYKTTTNKDMAIRDIKLMSMDSGYTVYDYNDMIDYLRSQNAGRAQAFAESAKGFVEYYNAGSPRAIDAYKALNLFRINKEGKDLLGDYIVEGKADQSFFSDLIVKANTQAINAVIGFINIGLTPYLNEYDEQSGEMITSDWASTVSQSELWQKYDAGLTADEGIALDKQYNDIARELFHQIQDFTTLYENARALAGENYENLNLDTNGDIDDAPEAMENTQSEDTGLSYIVCYEKLNEYNLNEETKLGDWFLELGHHTSDNIDLRQLYPIIDAMGEKQAYIVETGGIISAVFNLAKNEHIDEIDKMISDVKKEVKSIDGKETLYIFDNHDDDFIEWSRFAVTNESYRQSAATNPVDRTSFWWDDFYSVYYPAYTMVSFILGAVYAAIGVVAIVAFVGGFVTGLMASACAVLSVISAVLMNIFNAICWLNTVAGAVFSMVTMAVTLVIVIFMFVNLLIQEFKKVVKSEFQSEKPDYIIDTRENGKESINVLYECVRDDYFKNVQDVNASKQWKWTVMAVTRDPRVGSPIVADENGNVFKQVNGNAAFQTGYESVRYFGERNPGDFNAYCEKNTVSGAYLHYHTEESVKSYVPEETTEPEATEPAKEENNAGSSTENKPAAKEVNYISDIVVAIAATPEKARNEIIRRETKTYVFDHNLSPNQEFATYIGYSLTTKVENAVTDIRIATNVGQSQSSNKILYGNAEYVYSHIIGWDTGEGNKQGTPTCDALYYTKDSKAGDPIPADNLMTTQSLTEVGEDSEWIPVSFFGNDQPYNFDNAFYNKFTTLEWYNCYWSKEDNYLNSMPSSYLYFKPENAKKSGTKYLSGIFFAGGYDNNDTLFDDIGGDSPQLISKLLLNEKTKDVGISLSYSIGDRKWGKMYNDINLRLLYTWSYYPKRALTNIVAYQGDSYSTSLPYTLSKPLDGVQQSFVAATNLQQQFLNPNDGMARFAMPGNTIRNSNGCVYEDSYHDWELARDFNSTRTDVLPEGVPFGYKKAHFLPTAAYVCGPVEGKEPLKLEDVIISQTMLAPTYEDGIYRYTLDEVGWDTDYTYSETREAPDGKICTLEPDTHKYNNGRKEAVGDFKPVVDIKNPNSPDPFNFSYPRALNSKNNLLRETQPCYIYIRGKKTEKQKYISSLSVGAYSRAQFKKDNPSQDEKLADSIAEGTAMFAAASGCKDEIIIFNIAAANQNNAWYNWQKDGVSQTKPPENVPAAYIGVSRTDDPKQAITGVILYEHNEMIAPNQITVNKVKYTCAGSTMPIIINGKKYFLYYSKNAGDSVGFPIEDIMIDTTPVVAGYATNLCADKDSTEPYGNPDLPFYIHTKYTAEGDFFNKLYIGRGETKKQAMADLLSQGCTDSLDIDLNTGITGKTILLGYRRGYINWDEVNSKTTVDERKDEIKAQTTEAIYDIVITRGEPFHAEGIVRNNIYYYPVGTSALDADLNGAEGYELYMYYASPYYSADYNKKNNASTLLPQNVFTGYLTHLAFSESDRVPYNDTVSVSSDGQDNMPWEYVMQADNAAPVDLNDGAVSYSPHHAKDIRISMFAQRSDGSVKPSGEITGGFVKERYAIGDLYGK